jgi:hypothetical protein
LKNETVPDLLPHEFHTEDIIRKKFWKKRVKKIPKLLNELEINKKLIKWGKNKKSID